MKHSDSPYVPTSSGSDALPNASPGRGPTVRVGGMMCFVSTLLYWIWESRTGGNIRIDLVLFYPLLFGIYLYSLQRLRWVSGLIALGLMVLNFFYFIFSYSLFDLPTG
ncbi:hypothetical protein SAMN06265222_12049 [Neorhodopirellula lusitana]|uniref:Uncharacterized protein n=1 Tax=Neorhodopirellula lusitana TaxID=445327 RepID=A0ABY1QN08_9BACT|nr:hypothetical protein [Neorhodopirellula lusitana]SMP75936.1 hypothetical protein SAMN06265222_12049 [Neorhodopirellula lusitana]